MGLNLGTYNILDSCGFELPQAIQAVKRGNYDLKLLTDTKILDKVYRCNCLGCEIVFSRATATASGGAHGGLGILFLDKPEGWIVKSKNFHRPNMVTCKPIAGDQLILLIGAYLPSSTLYHLSNFQKALKRFQVRDPVIQGDLKVDIGRLRNPWDQQVAYFLFSFGLVDLLAHFGQCPSGENPPIPV